VFGIFATIAGLLYVCMPETLGHVLPDTVEQAEQFGRCATKKLGSVNYLRCLQLHHYNYHRHRLQIF